MNIAAFHHVQAAALDRVVDRCVSELGLFERDPFDAPLGRCRSWTAEAPRVSSAELGLDEARALATGQVKQTSKKSDVSWASALWMDRGGQSLSSLTIWNAPVVEVPHLHCSVACGGGIDLTIDFRPRADAAYDTILPDGTYPEPTDREMFMQGSLRKDLAASYFTPEAEAWCAGVRAAAGAQARPRGMPTGCAGPLLLEVTLPPTDEGLAAATAACEGAVELWLGWMAVAEKLDQRRTMTTFAHDTKLRASLRASVEAELIGAFGPEAADLAAANEGPLDLADRGATLNTAAKGNWGDDMKDDSIRDIQILIDQGYNVLKDGIQ